LTTRCLSGRPTELATVPRVGLFGDLGMGNIGNDASMEAVLNYLRADHPDAVVDAMCAGPEIVCQRYGLPAVPMSWYHQHHASGAAAIPLKLLGKGLDVFRTAAWVRRHDVVIVPGMGIFESSLPLRPWGLPQALFVVGASGRLFRTKVAYVSVGADIIRQRMTQRLLDWAARLAYYRSYRDADSREAMRQWGLDTARDPVYPDLAFALPAPPSVRGDSRIVCVGVMDYHGSNDDRMYADRIRRSYIAEMSKFIRWLLDDGRCVRLLVGDTNGSDDEVVREIVTSLRRSAPNLDPFRLVAHPVVSFADVMRAMTNAGSVVAIRFHNVVAALMLCKPTIAISYGPKHNSLMADMDVAEFLAPVRTLDHDLLTRQFTELEGRAAELRQKLAGRKAANEQLLEEQFSRLSVALFPKRESVSP
jgi:polysaccharide pyruvyl transferase WcaK-like protein